MRKFLIIFTLLLPSSQAFAWSMSWSFVLTDLHASAITNLSSPAAEEDVDPPINAAITISKVIEESVFVVQKVSPCIRVPGFGMACGAVASDFTLTNGCKYCTEHKGTVYEDIPGGEFVDTATFVSICRWWTDPDID